MAKSFFTKRSRNITHYALHNQYVLYFVFFVAIGNLFMLNDFMSAFVFFTAGLLTSFFSRNMVVILITATVVSNIIRIGKGFHDKEGFKLKKMAKNKKKKTQRKVVCPKCEDANGNEVMCNEYTAPDSGATPKQTAQSSDPPTDQSSDEYNSPIDD